MSENKGKEIVHYMVSLDPSKAQSYMCKGIHFKPYRERKVTLDEIDYFLNSPYFMVKPIYKGSNNQEKKVVKKSLPSRSAKGMKDLANPEERGEVVVEPVKPKAQGKEDSQEKPVKPEKPKGKIQAGQVKDK